VDGWTVFRLDGPALGELAGLATLLRPG
jgi:hypothetical protein